MAPSLEPIKRFPCSYKDCVASFDTEKQMKSHKKHSPEHDYCHKCNLDFDSYADLNKHKAFRPDKHQFACRVCGEEFRSRDGVKLHIERHHRVDQKLRCFGCDETFIRASLLVEHFEFGHCRCITPSEFSGFIVHKHLIAELLKGGANYERFMKKISKYDAAVDNDEGGGVTIMDKVPDESEEQWGRVLQPEVLKLDDSVRKSAEAQAPCPRLPGSKPRLSQQEDVVSELSSKIRDVSLIGDSDSVTVGSTTYSEMGSSNIVPGTQAWRKAELTKSLFPRAPRGASSTAATEWSVEKVDRQVAVAEGINILDSRFWDPSSKKDWNPQRFYDTELENYCCPFVCEQRFDIPADLVKHIFDSHRVTKMRCPRCLDVFGTCTALVAHCETGSRKCDIRNASDFGHFLDRLTGGFLGVEEKVRPDHENNDTVKIVNPINGYEEDYLPPAPTYLKYSVTKPSGYQLEEKMVTIGGSPKTNQGLLE